MNASECKKLTEDSIKSRYCDDLDFVLETIKTSASDGYFNKIISPLSDRVVDALESLGYKVSYPENRTNKSFEWSISWA